MGTKEERIKKIRTREKRTKKSRASNKDNPKTLKRTKEQILADTELSFDLSVKGYTIKEIADHINKLRGYNPPLTSTSYANSLRDFRRSRTLETKNKIAEYANKSSVTLQMLMDIALKQFNLSLAEPGKTIVERFDKKGELVNKTVTTKEKADSISWFAQLSNLMRLDLQAKGEITGSSNTFNVSAKQLNIGGRNKNIEQMSHLIINGISDEKLTKLYQMMVNGEDYDQFLIEGEVIDATN
jgi:hypothetical protein